MSFEIGALQYALGATRIQTATNGALDLASEDYFGPPLGPYAVTRQPGEADSAYSAQLLAAMLPHGATRAAIIEVVTKITGNVPRVIEPWSPADTGVWDGGPGAGMMFWDIDSAVTPFRWTDPGLTPFQGFVECTLPQAQEFGNNPTPAFDSTAFYWDVAGSSLIDPTLVGQLGEAAVYNAINQTKVEGTIVWVKFVPPPGINWDQAGVNWDEAGISWG
jgi:hypothetical protein